MAFAEPTVAPTPEPFLAAPRIKRCTFRRVTAVDRRRERTYDVDCLFPDRALADAAGRPGERAADLQRLHGVGDLPGRRGLTRVRVAGSAARRRRRRAGERVGLRSRTPGVGAEARGRSHGARRGCQRGDLYAGFCPAVPRRGTVTVIHLGPPVARRLMRPTRGLRRRAGVPVARDASSYLALLRVELASFHPAAGCPPAGSSLWRWSSPRGGRALPATLRRRARTFLTPPVARRRATVRSPR